MSDSDTDNRSAASSNKSNNGSGSVNNRRFPQQQPVQKVQIGIEELKGYYYVYGRPDQAQAFRKTTEKIADHIAQNYKSGKEMYRLITYGVETTYKDPDDPGKDATPAQIKAYGLLFTAAREDRLQYHNDKFKTFRLIMGQCIPYKYQQEDAATQEEEGNKFKACLLLGNADRDRYKEVIDELANDYSLGNDNYPKDPATMVAMLSNRRGTVSTKKIDAMKDGILTSFGQTNNGPRCKYCKSRIRTSDRCKDRKKGDGLKGVTSFGSGKGQGNPWANKDSDSGSESSGPKGWFRPVKGEPR
jgi:hypothetical protein